MTYGRFDLLDQDHISFLRSLRGMGGSLIVGCLADKPARALGLACQMPFEARRAMLEHCRYVDRVIQLNCESQARTDIVNYNVSTFVMGEERRSNFDHLQDIAQILYLPRCRASTGAVEWMPVQGTVKSA